MPKTKWIHNIHSPKDLQKIPLEKLPEVAAEYREALIETVAKTGGHLGASLGALELNVALHYVLDVPTDKVCWDVGHQAYVHKMITGRLDKMSGLRKHGGISGFPSPFESDYDHFIVGHAGTAISQAVGLAAARDIQHGQERVVAVVGDGAMTAGLSYEALNNAGHLKKDMLIVLNDNEMSISRNVGGISKYFNKMLTNPIYNRIRSEAEKRLERFPRLRRLTTAGLEGMKHLLVPGILFEELGLRYFGPVDGHDVIGLVETLRKVLALKDCCLLHIITEKGRGCKFAEIDSERLHGVVPFNTATGEKIQPKVDPNVREVGVAYTKAFADALVELARKDPKVVAITAAMPTGTGLTGFQKEFPDRFFDVGIAEQHAVTFGGALAKGGLKPVCAIYSTFLQRAQDNLLHDVALQRLPMVVAMDRAGLVGADGATHNGVFDISFMGHIPDAVIAAPKDVLEMRRMLELGLAYPGIFSLRYPRGEVPAVFADRKGKDSFAIGEGEVLLEGEDVSLLALGSMVEIALKAQALLNKEGVRTRVVNMRFARPLDGRLIRESVEKSRLVFTLEEHVFTGGFGSKVLEWAEANSLSPANIRRIALPDRFIEHGSKDILFDELGLSPERIAERVVSELRSNSVPSPAR